MSDERMVVESIAMSDLMLKQALGKYPWVLLQLLPDREAPDKPVLTVRAGNGPERHPIMLPITYVMTAPPEGNPVAEMLRNLYAEAEGNRAGVLAVADEFNSEWLPFVKGETHAGE